MTSHTNIEAKEDFPSELGMRVTEIVLNKNAGWSIELEEVLDKARTSIAEESRRDIPTLKQFKNFLAENCWEVQAYKEGKYDKKIYKFLTTPTNHTV